MSLKSNLALPGGHCAPFSLKLIEYVLFTCKWVGQNESALKITHGQSAG